ncbi:MAG: ABC transporter permease [Candidatus Dojkabacteria bacterium]
MHNTLLVAKREYVKVVRKKTFWISTLLLPVFMVIIAVISGFSAAQSEQSLREQVEGANKILIQDRSGIIDTEGLPENINFIVDAESQAEEAVEQVRSGEVKAYIQFPRDLRGEEKIDIYVQSEGVFGGVSFNEFAEDLIRSSVINDIEDEERRLALQAEYEFSTVEFDEGERVDRSLEDFIIPVFTIVVYFVLISFATSYLLMSVSEEKENRMIEIILSIVTPRELILGKIFGQVGVIFTQLLILVAFGAVIIPIVGLNLPVDIDFSGISVDPVQILISLFYLVCGFLILGNIMVGVGAAVPTYKDAQGFSSVFIIMSIMPVYFASLIITDPSGTLARILSYIPFTAPLVLLFRSALDELSILEFVLTGAILIATVIGTFYLAFKLFEIGSLEYSKKISLRRLWK